MPNSIGRPGRRTMEMNGGSSASYLERTLYAPLFAFCSTGMEAKGFLDCQGTAGTNSIVSWNLRPVIPVCFEQGPVLTPRLA